MVSRLDRNRPLPDAPRGRVDDSQVQRALDSIVAPLRAIIQFLQPYVQPDPWHKLEPYYYADWTDNPFTDQGMFRKDPQGNVEIRLWVYSAAGTDSTIAVLPEGYRPAHRESFSLSRYTGGAYSFALVSVDTDGRVLIASPSMPAAAIELSLSGIRFSTEA